MTPKASLGTYGAGFVLPPVGCCELSQRHVLSESDECDGVELVVADLHGSRQIKFAAGDLVSCV
ncbi:hypothetical protein LMTR13_23560 [Bradyrhizobium icense]|uniref:Uncharacterized protein n=1 Tax=Bradyrhizobium icense TaxID=1274631 RepID=A0A1B1UIU0_9BRAD|nr:hypothetical protein LMTR13_23560 [Bradyrhizobium icense]